jgi:hypothetical protein
VRVRGRVTKQDDVCTPMADRLADTRPRRTPDGEDGDGADGGSSVATATPGDEDPADDATAPPDPPTSPGVRPAEEGSITDPEETTSPAPDVEP